MAKRESLDVLTEAENIVVALSACDETEHLLGASTPTARFDASKKELLLDQPCKLSVGQTWEAFFVELNNHYAEHEKRIDELLAKQNAEHEKRVDELLDRQQRSISRTILDDLPGKLSVQGRTDSNGVAPRDGQGIIEKHASLSMPHEDSKPEVLMLSLPNQIEEPRTSFNEASSGLVTDEVQEHEASDDVLQQASFFGVAPSQKSSANFKGTSLGEQIEEMTEYQKSFARGSTVNFEVGRGNLRDRVRRAVSNRSFEFGVCFLIMLNALCIGLEVDWDMANPGKTSHPAFRAVNVFFIVCFTFEIILRLVSEQWTFFVYRNSKFGWNVFDSLLVVTALIEEALSAALSSSPDMSAMRVFRTMRIIRGFRIVRVFAFFRDLRIMVAGIVHSLYSLVWALLLLVSMMYLFSVCLLQFVSAESASRAGGRNEGTVGETDYQNLITYFGSLTRTIYTLYLSIVGGIDWNDAAEPLVALNSFLGLLYCCYVAFAVLCVLNIITGVFVENANRISAQDEETVIIEQMEQRKQWFEEVKELFSAADTDNNGCLNREEFTEKMKDLRLQAWFRKIGVQVENYSAASLFGLLDFDGDGILDLDEFAMALQQVHGPARSIDVAKIHRETRLLRRDFGRMAELLSAQRRASEMGRVSGARGKPSTATKMSTLVVPPQPPR